MNPSGVFVLERTNSLSIHNTLYKNNLLGSVEALKEFFRQKSDSENCIKDRDGGYTTNSSPYISSYLQFSDKIDDFSPAVHCYCPNVTPSCRLFFQFLRCGSRNMIVTHITVDKKIQNCQRSWLYCKMSNEFRYCLVSSGVIISFLMKLRSSYTR